MSIHPVTTIRNFPKCFPTTSTPNTAISQLRSVLHISTSHVVALPTWPKPAADLSAGGGHARLRSRPVQGWHAGLYWNARRLNSGRLGGKAGADREQQLVWCRTDRSLCKQSELSFLEEARTEPSVVVYTYTIWPT